MRVSWAHVADEDDSPHTRVTRHMVIDPVVGWPYAVAALERLNVWTVMALRLGTLALLQECVAAMALRGARKELVVRARELVDALDRMPWDA